MATKSTSDSMEQGDRSKQELLEGYQEKKQTEGKSSISGLRDQEKDMIKQREDFEAEIEQSVPEGDSVDSFRDVDGEYNTTHKKRGECLIFVNKEFKSGSLPHTKKDIEACEAAFGALGFRVTVHKDLRKADLLRTLKEAGNEDRTDDDALIIIFSSHGNTNRAGREVLNTYDGTVDASHLWASFIQNPSLQGKPKLFFVDACRGGGLEETVKVGLQVSTDSADSQQPRTAPVFYYPDILVMNSSYAGMQSITTGWEKDFRGGSVFLQLLCQALQDARSSDSDLLEVMLEVTRRVGVRFNKQLPQISSTLTKRVRFW